MTTVKRLVLKPPLLKQLILASGLLLGGAVCHADEITILSAAAVQAPLMEIVARFEKTTKHTVRIEYATAGGVDAALKGGGAKPTPDIVINSRERLLALHQAGVVFAAPLDLGVVQMGIAARRGAPKPDISSLEGFKASLLAARSIAYGNPARGATTGIHFAKMLDQMGIAQSVNAKALLRANGLDVMRTVFAGDADYGITQISEIVHMDSELLVGPMPAEIQLNSTYSASLRSATVSDASKALMKTMVDASARASFEHAGFKPAF